MKEEVPSGGSWQTPKQFFFLAESINPGLQQRPDIHTSLVQRQLVDNVCPPSIRSLLNQIPAPF